ncbi:MAG: hypothetical protein OHK0039_25260 [Bacteroidia bacterium]
MQSYGIRILFLLTGLLVHLSLCAAVIPVTSLADSGPGSLRALIAAAAENDTLDLGALSGTLALDAQIVIDRNLHIAGPGATLLAISGQDRTRLFLIADSTDTVHISGLTLRNGSAYNYPGEFYGGGCILNYGHLTLQAVHLTVNKAAYGGAVLMGGPGNRAFLYLYACTFSRNLADRDTLPNLPTSEAGGAIFADGTDQGVAKIVAINCTFSGNIATDRGGAATLIGDIDGGTEFRATHCTIARNEAPIGGGVDNFIYAAVVFANTILSENEGVNTPNLAGYAESQGNNLFGPLGLADIQPDPSDLLAPTAGLADLAYYSPALPTHALACGSAAIDAANPAKAPAGDQNDRPRVGLPDIGAHERSTATDTRIYSLADAGAGTLRQAVFLACPGDSLLLDDLHGVVALQTAIALDKPLVIRGNLQRPLILDGTGQTRIFDIGPAGTLDLSWLTLRNGNPPLYGGGAIRNQGRLRVSHSTFAGNRATAGGAIGNYGIGDTAWLWVENCTFAANSATDLDGGAIDNRALAASTQVYLDHATLVGNYAANKGGALYNEGGTLSLRNSLAANNTAPLGGDVAGTATSEGHNLLGDYTGLTPAASDLTGVDPLLDVLGNYGGPTFTYRLQAGSPAIDAAAAGALQYDQRGEARSFNGSPDIGAYEYDPATGLAAAAWTAVRVYPNPASQTVWIADLPAGRYRLRLLDMRGRIWEEQTLHSHISPLLLDLPTAAVGIYVLEITGTAGLYRTKLLIKP